MNRIALLVFASFASGCTTFPTLKQSRPVPVASYVYPEISHADAGKIAKDMAAFLSMQLPPAKTTIELDSIGTSFHDILFTELVWRGFGVVENPEDEAIRFKYFVTPLDQGVLVRMRYSQQAAGRFYNRKDGKLSANAYLVREVNK